ncbi:hypothetical protein HY970_00670 [Candidatus Kaiserbacteria bacterium]|nr:hypothetical protein [Candidatus Kaiserbacteria bacterium]
MFFKLGISLIAIAIATPSLAPAFAGGRPDHRERVEVKTPDGLELTAVNTKPTKGAVRWCQAKRGAIVVIQSTCRSGTTNCDGGCQLPDGTIVGNGGVVYNVKGELVNGK